MARWLGVNFVLLVCFCSILTAMELPDQHNLSEEDTDAVRDLYYPPQLADVFVEHQLEFQPRRNLMSPEDLRARWLALYKEMNANNRM